VPQVVEAPAYVDIVIVDKKSGVPQFPIFERVLQSSITKKGKMTEFTFRGKREGPFFLRVLENDPYTDDDVPQIGAITIPNPEQPGTMIVLRLNQSSRDVYYDEEGMYYKTGSGVLQAPEHASFPKRPLSPH
jgi:hypothetical protein